MPARPSHSMTSSKLLHVDPEERVIEENLSIHSFNPFVIHNSANRGQMSSGHLAQPLVLLDGDEKIVQSGLDHQLGENTFSIKILEDCYVLKVIERYRTLDSKQKPVEITVFVETLSGKYDYYTIPHYFSLHQYFGFEYNTDKDAILNIPKGALLKEGTVLADSPSVRKNSGYAYGTNANIALVTLPGGAQDGAVISESFAKKLSYKQFETRIIEFGSNKFLLNLYGDNETYKGYPEIGESINGDSILAALRPNDESLAPCLTSKEDLKRFDPEQDTCVYVSSPGRDVMTSKGMVKSGKVVDIKAYHNPKKRNNDNVYPVTLGSTERHVDNLKNYYKDIIDFYLEHIKGKNKNRNPDGSINMSERLNKLIQQAFAIGDFYGKKLPYIFKKSDLDIYRLEFTVEFTYNAIRGSKISDGNGFL